MADQIQFVNLPTRDSSYASGLADSSGQIGPVLSMKFTCKKGALTGWRIRLKQTGADNAVYTNAELKRNPRFKGGLTAIVSNKGLADGTYEDVFNLPAAGGNEYQLEYLYQGQVKLSGATTIKTRRALWYQVMSMAGVAAKPVAAMEAEFLKEDRKHFVKLQRKGGSATIPKIGIVVDKADEATLCTELAKVYTLRPFGKHAFAVCYVDYIGKPGDELVDKGFAVSANGTVAKLQQAPGGAGYLPILLKQDLWRNLGDARPWRKGLPDCTFESADKSISIAIPASLERDPAVPKRYAHGGYRGIRLKLDAAALKQVTDAGKAGTIFCRFKVRIANSFSNGLSYSTVNLVLVAVRARWEDRTDASIGQTLIHEIGHKIGMVADGSAGRLAPDRPPFYYHQDLPAFAGTTHAGRHCSKGATYDLGTKAWSGNPQCVMYGAGHSQRPASFCEDCSKALRKLDLSSAALTVNGFSSIL
jgi:hypothetical protein